MFNLNYYKMKNFLRYANANAMATISICNMDHTVQDLNLWKVDLVQTEIELISLNPAIDGQHKLILEWVITPPDYDETIDLKAPFVIAVPKSSRKQLLSPVTTSRLFLTTLIW